MEYKKVDKHTFDKYFPELLDGRLEMVHRISSKRSLFGKYVASTIKAKDFSGIAAYGLLPKNHTKRYYSEFDLHFYISKEYLTLRLIGAISNEEI